MKCPWTEDEKAIVRHYYPAGGAGLVMQHLPNRTRSQIGHLAHYLNIRSGGTKTTTADAHAVLQITSHYPDIREVMQDYMATKAGHGWRCYRGKNGLTTRPLGRMVLETEKPYVNGSLDVLQVATQLIEARRA